MKPRNTLIVVALFALLLGYVYFVEINKTPEALGTPQPTPQPYVFQLPAVNVQGVQITDLQGSREVKLSRADKGWRVDKPVEKNADSVKVDSIVGQLVTLQASRVLTNVTDFGKFGFVTATLEVRMVMSDTNTYALTVGDKAPDNANYYAVYTGDKSKVFIVPGVLVDELRTWLSEPPYEPTPTPTFTPTPIVTPTITPTLTITMTPAAAPPNIVPTVLPGATETPKP